MQQICVCNRQSADVAAEIQLHSHKNEFRVELSEGSCQQISVMFVGMNLKRAAGGATVASTGRDDPRRQDRVSPKCPAPYTCAQIGVLLAIVRFKEFFSVSFNRHGCFLCRVIDGGLSRSKAAVSIAHRHQRLRRTCTSSYVGLNIEVWICSLVSLTISDSCPQGASWPPRPLRTFHSAADLTCWDIRRGAGGAGGYLTAATG